MMEELSALAVVPKAKAIAAKRLTRAEYAELMRKRSVLEIVAVLREHPYFQKSLRGLDGSDIHRQQLEQALSKDIFYKYESLIRYITDKKGVSSFFMLRCEITELLAKLQLLSMGFRHHYIMQLPGFLADKTSFSLIALAQAETPAQCLAVVAGTPYARLIAPLVPETGWQMDYLACEHILWAYFYETVLSKIRPGREAAQTKKLFLMEAEIYNIDLLHRAKAFFNDSFSPEKLKGLLLPCRYILGTSKLRELAAAADLQDFLRIYDACAAHAFYGERTANPLKDDSVQAYRTLSRAAQRLIHFSASPETVLVALTCLATIERSNIVNIVEGVRYGLSAAQIEYFLKY